MSVSIGGLVYNGASGTPYPAVDPGQLEAWATAAEAFRFQGSPRKDGGEIMAWLDCDEATAQRRLLDQGGQIGYIITVAYPHGNITGLIVARVDGEWQARKGTTNGGVLVVRIIFDYENDKDSGDVEKSLVWCETADALAGPWTKQEDWACMGSQDGLGTYAGDAEASIVNALPDLSLIGKWVRLVRKEDYPTTKTVEWVGVILNAQAHGRRDPSTGVKWGTKTTYQFAGSAAVLARLYPTEWRGTRQGGEDFGGPSGVGADTAQAVCGYMDFNAEGGKDRGNTVVQVDAATTVDGVAMPEVYLHGTGVGPMGARWKAREALRTFLAICRKNLGDKLPIVIPTSYDALMVYEETWSVGGQSVLDFIAQVLNPSVKRTFRLETICGEAGVSGTGFIRVVPIDLDATGTEIDVSTNASSTWEASIDGTQTADRWYLDAGPREYIATVDFDAASAEDGTKGWTAADAIIWDGRTGIGKVDSKILAVWSRYVMRRDWVLLTAIGPRIPSVRQVTLDEETGELSGNQPIYPDGVYGGLRISRTLPFGPGADFAASSTKPISPKTPVTGPMVWWLKGTEYTLAHEDYQVQVEAEMAGITLGRGGSDQEKIKAKLADASIIRATLSFIHFLSWRVSKKSGATQPRTDAPRLTMSQLRPARRRVDIIQDTVVGLTDSTTPVLAAAGRKDDGPDLAGFGDAFRKWFLTDTGSLVWTAPSVDSLTPIAGTILSQAKVTVTAGPPPTVGTIALGGIPVSQRRISWDRYNPGVTWSASRIMPSITMGGKGAVVAQNGNAPVKASPGAKTGTTQPKPNRGL